MDRAVIVYGQDVQVTVVPGARIWTSEEAGLLAEGCKLPVADIFA